MTQTQLRLVSSRSFGGKTFDPEQDGERLGRQLDRVRNYMVNSGQWWTLREIEAALDYPQASISARLRDLRKDKHGAYEVKRRRRRSGSGTWEYKVKG